MPFILRSDFSSNNIEEISGIVLPSKLTTLSVPAFDIEYLLRARAD